MSRSPLGALIWIVDVLYLSTRNLRSESTDEPSAVNTPTTWLLSGLMQVKSKGLHAGTSMLGGVIITDDVGGLGITVAKRREYAIK